METAVEVAGYLAAAGIGGVIGNRADSAVVQLFTSVRDRWRNRGAGTDDAPLHEDEATDAATAAALTLGYDPESLNVQAAEHQADGSWRLTLLTPTAELHVRVPPGDPTNATILILAH